MYHDGFVDDLLQLRVFEVVADHRLEDAEQLSVGNESVFVDIVDSESNRLFDRSID